MGRRKKEPRSVHRENIAARAVVSSFLHYIKTICFHTYFRKYHGKTDRIKLEQNRHNKEWRYRLLYGIMNFQP